MIVDDEPQARQAHTYAIEDMGLKPEPVEGPLENLQKFIHSIKENTVVLSDFHLKKKSYANCNGDQLVAMCFQAKIPSALCTTIEDAPIRRDCLRYIPGLIDVGTPDSSLLRQAWEKCAKELDNHLGPTRRPWRTLVRIDDVDNDHQCIHVVVPAWDVERKVRIDIDNLPLEIQKLIQPDRRFHALVNTGAENYHELFFDAWETR